jgi:hypothetical protein
LDLIGEVQIINDEGNSIYLDGQFENYIGSVSDDIIHINPMDQPRIIDGGGSSKSGDVIIVETMGLTPIDDGSTITIPGYAPITYSNFSQVIYEDVTAVDLQDEIIPTDYVLQQNYPNPFNPTTTIKYSIPSLETLHATSPQLISVQLNIYDVLGKKVATLVNKQQKAGNYKITFNAGNLSNGIYFYRLQSGNFTDTKKLMLVQ